MNLVFLSSVTEVPLACAGQVGGDTSSAVPSTAPTPQGPTPQGPTPQTLAAQTPWTAGDGPAGGGGTPSDPASPGPVNPTGGGAVFNQGGPAAASGISARGAGGAAATGGVTTEAATISPGQTLAHGDHVVSSVATNTGSATSVTNAVARGSGGVNWGRRLLRGAA